MRLRAIFMKGCEYMTKIDISTLDEIAQLEAEALLEGLKDPDQRKNPSFLEKVRKFLKENYLVITPEDNEAVKELKQTAIETQVIPMFPDEVKTV